MPEITINSNNIDYSLHYSKRRKTISIKVVGINQVEIILPAGIKSIDVRQMLTHKFEWIKNQMERLKQIQAHPFAQSIENGSPMPYLGKVYSLKLLKDSGSKCLIRLEENCLIIGLPVTSTLRDVLEAWYRKTALNVLTQRTTYWSLQLNAAPKKITIKDQRTRWGSCSSLGNINYNWRIVLAPQEIVDYLVIHELAHLIEPNHSQDFWQIVAAFCPDYKSKRDWLQTNGRLLMRFLNKE